MQPSRHSHTPAPPPADFPLPLPRQPSLFHAAFEEVHNSLLYITFDIVIIVNLMPIA
jgi:hypothetical protein